MQLVIKSIILNTVRSLTFISKFSLIWKKIHLNSFVASLFIIHLAKWILFKRRHGSKIQKSQA